LWFRIFLIFEETQVIHMFLRRTALLALLILAAFALGTEQVSSAQAAPQATEGKPTPERLAALEANPRRVSRASLAQQRPVLRNRHTWIMSGLYVGTFGSFIGFSAAFPLLIAKTFPGVSAVSYAFLGPLVGSLSRPLGGALADRYGGARVTAAVFAGQAACIPWVIGSVHAHNWPSYLAAFLTMFVITGLGNGSTFRMIPAIFRRTSDDPARHAAAALGIAGAVGALGGFLIPVSLGISSPHGTAAFDPRSLDAPFYGFLAVYVACLALTWFCYLRRGVFALTPQFARP